MKKLDKKGIIKIIEDDPWMIQVLKSAKSLNLPDCWVGGGFIRSKIWDYLHDYSKRTPLPDIDVIYLDPADYTKDEAQNHSTRKEEEYELKLNKLMPGNVWSVTNQARMHLYHNKSPYKISKDAMRDWVETATGVGARLNEKNEVELIASWGIDDLVNLILRPSETKPERLKEFNRRIKTKKWLEQWPKLRVIS